VLTFFWPEVGQRKVKEKARDSGERAERTVNGARVSYPTPSLSLFYLSSLGRCLLHFIFIRATYFFWPISFRSDSFRPQVFWADFLALNLVEPERKLHYFNI